MSGGDSHGHSHGPPSPTKKPAKKSGKKAKKSDDESAADTDYDTDHERRPLISHDDDEEARTLRAVSILNLLSDFLHNFTDGLAIGASFITGVEAGICASFRLTFRRFLEFVSQMDCLIVIFKKSWSKHFM